MGEFFGKIVLAEDEPASRKLLTRQLELAGYTVIACEDGRVALDAVMQEKSCVVIADWMMPVMDGLEFCRLVRERSALGDLGFVYFILLTAHNERSQVVAGFEAGADDYLIKPYNQQELLARIRAGVRIYNLNDELRRANADLVRLANTDPLTGIANRRSLFERFGEMWSRAQRQSHRIGCILLDIDRFKRTNDVFGHVAGDFVLRGVAEHTRQSIRPYDLFGRYGGEEFCVVTPDIDVHAATAIAERIRMRIAAQPFQFAGKEIPVTVSLGVAERRYDHDSLESLIGDADAMLYRAKEGGRNQTWLMDPEHNAARAEPVSADELP